MTEEIWKDVVGYEGLYLISNRGVVKSVGGIQIPNGPNSTRLWKGRVLRTMINQGYLAVYLCYQRKMKWKTMHRMVAEAFISNPENKPEVNHIDGNKQNNNDWNLEWNTSLENVTHAYLNGNGPKRKKGQDHRLSKVVLNLETGIYYDSIRDAANTLPVLSQTLSKRLNGTRPNNTKFTFA